MEQLGTEVGGNTKVANLLEDRKKKRFEKRGSLDYDDKKYRAWFLTINNPTEPEIVTLRSDDWVYMVYQIEVGKKGTEHLHAYLYYKNPRVWPKRKFPRARIEVVKKLDKARAYCMKEDTRISGPFEFGKIPEQGARNDLTEVAEAVLSGTPVCTIATDNPGLYVRYHRGLQALAASQFKDRTAKPFVTWLWGLSGTGKTKEAFGDGASVYIKDGTMWWDNYRQQERVVIDDFDGKWPYRDLLRVLDRYPYQGQVKGGYVPLNSPYIFITCEFPPAQFWGGNELDQVLRRLDIVKRC